MSGRPEFEPSKEERFAVMVAIACGARQEDIAFRLKIDRKTLRKHFRVELKNGKQDANAAMAQNLFKKATGNGAQSVTATIFWLKTKAGWKETTVSEHVGANGTPLVPQPTMDIEKFKEAMRELKDEV